MFGFSKEEVKVFKTLNCPKKIQDFLNKIPTNYEKDGETVLSPRMVLKQNKAHCMEGAMLAATALRFQGHPPLIVDLEAAKNDDDHVITVFKKYGHWGAISKTNHATLRYREPIYKTIRELVMSYFHEYFTNQDCKKTLRSYSRPINLSKFDKQGWMTAAEDPWYIPEYLSQIYHQTILNRSQIAFLRRAEDIERLAGSILEWPK
ncbi:MAG TPA: hypothetical protein VJH68_03810 [Candidatus Nanoarchaeia archaeon]|nr:hypothetical protein [Candidatus Nanoarchaeia archaeon]